MLVRAVGSRVPSGPCVLGPAELADTARARMRGLLGRAALDGVIVLAPANSVHTIGMQFGIDVLYAEHAESGQPSGRRSSLVGAELRLTEITSMAPNRLGRPRRGCAAVIEAEAGAAAAWGLTAGDVVSIAVAEAQAR